LERLTIKKAPQLLERLYGGEDGAKNIQISKKPILFILAVLSQ
jgi:hypothetical protein